MISHHPLPPKPFDGERWIFLRRSPLLIVILALVVASLILGRNALSHAKSRSASLPTTPSASGRPSRLANTPTFVFLPVVHNLHDPNYVFPFGIAMFGPLDDTTGLAMMKNARTRWVMTEMSWAEVQPLEGGPFNWSAHDVKFANAAAAGMEVYVLFDDNPSWVTPARRGPVPPDKIDDLQNVVMAMAERYDGAHGQTRVDYWSFYGEPDNIAAWGNNGAQYANMLFHVAPIIHRINPNAKVLIGGVAYDLFTDDELGGPRAFVRSFLTDTLQSLETTYPGGASSYIDAVAFHYYPISLPRWPTLRDKARDVKGIMDRHNVGHLPLLVPEMSMWSNWPSGENQLLQAQYLVQFFVRGLSAGIQQLYWFQVFDVPDNPATSADDYTRSQGLFRENNLNDPKLSYFALQVLIRELDRARYVSMLDISGAEGYVFSLDGRSKTVVWGTNDAAIPVDFFQACLRRIEMLGWVSTIIDGASNDLDGSANGRIRLVVARDEPLYIEACP